MALGLATMMLAGITTASRADSPLEGTMGRMGKALGAIKKAAADPAKYADALKAVAELEAASIQAKGLLPPYVDKLTGDAKQKAAEEYRTMIMGLIRTELDLEDALMNKKADDVKTGIASLEEIMKKGHEEFIPKQGKGGGEGGER